MPGLFPRVRVSGTALERGRQYGDQAAERIRRNVNVYRAVFEHYAGWDWSTVVEHAASYEPAIEAYRPHFLDEMRGIAEGAGLPYIHVLALNVRTEIMFAAVARAAAQECTALVVLPEASSDGHTLVAQNWDWKLEAADNGGDIGGRTPYWAGFYHRRRGRVVGQDRYELVRYWIGDQRPRDQ